MAGEYALHAYTSKYVYDVYIYLSVQIPTHLTVCRNDGRYTHV